MRHAGWGTLIRQREGVNWIHLSPTVPLDVFPDGSSNRWTINQIHLYGELVDAHIDAVHLRTGKQLVWQLNDPARLPVTAARLHEHFPGKQERFSDIPAGEREGLSNPFEGLCLYMADNKGIIMSGGALNAQLVSVGDGAQAHQIRIAGEPSPELRELLGLLEELIEKLEPPSAKTTRLIDQVHRTQQDLGDRNPPAGQLRAVVKQVRTILSSAAPTIVAIREVIDATRKLF